MLLNIFLTYIVNYIIIIPHHNISHLFCSICPDHLFIKEKEKLFIFPNSNNLHIQLTIQLNFKVLWFIITTTVSYLIDG